MIVDVHTHIWDSPDQLGQGASQQIHRRVAQPWDRPDASVNAHEAAMEPVQHAIILGFESQLLGASIPAEQVAKWVARRPDKYIGFAGIDPLAPGFLRKVDNVRALGLRGVTISPAGQGFHPSHTRAMQLYERCAELKLPIFVHPGTHLAAQAKLEYSQPYLLDEVARSFPTLHLVVGQVGYPWIEQTLVLIGKHEHVHADLSNVVTRPWQLYNLLLSAHQQGVMDRLLFGSDFPFCTPEKAITTIYSINTLTQGTPLPSVPREQLRSIVERDVLACLGLKERPASTASAAGAAKTSSAADASHGAEAGPQPSTTKVTAPAAMGAAASTAPAAASKAPPAAASPVGAAGVAPIIKPTPPAPPVTKNTTAPVKAADKPSAGSGSPLESGIKSALGIDTAKLTPPAAAFADDDGAMDTDADKAEQQDRENADFTGRNGGSTPADRRPAASSDSGSMDQAGDRWKKD